MTLPPTAQETPTPGTNILEEPFDFCAFDRAGGVLTNHAVTRAAYNLLVRCLHDAEVVRDQLSAALSVRDSQLEAAEHRLAERGREEK